MKAHCKRCATNCQMFLPDSGWALAASSFLVSRVNLRRPPSQKHSQQINTAIVVFHGRVNKFLKQMQHMNLAHTASLIHTASVTRTERSQNIALQTPNYIRNQAKPQQSGRRSVCGSQTGRLLCWPVLLRGSARSKALGSCGLHSLLRPLAALLPPPPHEARGHRLRADTVSDRGHHLVIIHALEACTPGHATSRHAALVCTSTCYKDGVGDAAGSSAGIAR